ncbi:Inositol-pentakisphosphate 2-kinase [Exophiala sideris]|nr:Inositol-pentakisphosphate 2-kinase [Exophiala sideris]
MRLRKDLPSTKPAVQTISDFEQRIVPLFAGHETLLMEQALYKLSPEMIEGANRELVEMDGMDISAVSADGTNAQGKSERRIRHHHRRHIYLPSYNEEQYGILMPNLEDPGLDWLIEFKPKCLENALARIWPIEEGLQAFAATFQKGVQPALSHLRALQQTHGSVGLQDFENPADKDFGLAMALRDCSVFLAMRRQEEAGGIDLVNVKLADLDLKTGEGGKFQKWAGTEQHLLDGGWYHRVEDSNCSLSRHKS